MVMKIIQKDTDLTSEEMVHEWEEGEDAKYLYKDTLFMMTPAIKHVRHGHENLIYDEET